MRSISFLPRFAAVCLALAVLLLAIVSCGSADDPGEKESGPAQTEAPSGQSSPSKETDAETDVPLMAHLPDKDFSNYQTFRTLHWTVDDSWIPWDEISVDGENGDVMNSSVLDRNAVVTERYGVAFETVYQFTYDMNDTMRALVKTGDHSYDLCVQRGVNLAQVYTEELFMSFPDIPYVDLSNPWWNQDSVRSLALGSVSQFTASDMLVLDKAATASFFFNNELANEYSHACGDMYQAVRDKTWTAEKVMMICDDVAQDLDNDGIYNGDNDLLAVMSTDDPVHFLYTGAGLRFMDHTEDGHFEYTFFDPENYTVMQEILSDFMFEGWFRNTYLEPLPTDKFRANEALFVISIVSAANNFRANEKDYGILPIPMWDESQDNYYSEVSPHHDSLLCILQSIRDPEFTGLMLEAVSNVAYYTSYPTFYDVVISGRSVRDEESKEMLKIIFETRVYDAGLVYDLKDFGSMILRSTASQTTTIASTVAAKRSMVEQALRDLNKLVDQLNG